MEYIVITTNDQSGISLMDNYSPNVVNVHNEAGYVIWVWHNATNDQVAQVTNSPSVISTVYITG